MRPISRLILRVLILFLAGWVVLDFGLSVEGAFAFDVDASLVGIHSTHGPTIPMVSPVVTAATCMPRDPDAGRRPVGAQVRAWSMPDHLVPRSRLLAAGDQTAASDDH